LIWIFMMILLGMCLFKFTMFTLFFPIYNLLYSVTREPTITITFKNQEENMVFVLYTAKCASREIHLKIIIWVSRESPFTWNSRECFHVNFTQVTFHVNFTLILREIHVKSHSREIHVRHILLCNTAYLHCGAWLTTLPL
jgi:hypothetical protein